MTAPDHGTYAVRLQRRTPAEQLRYLADRLSPEGRAPSATELAAVTHLLAELAGQIEAAPSLPGCGSDHDPRASHLCWLAAEALRQRAVLEGIRAAFSPSAALPHAYLSTSCLHGEHGYCSSAEGRSESGMTWAKTPASCKFCGATCTCQCHVAKDPDGMPAGWAALHEELAEGDRLAAVTRFEVIDYTTQAKNLGNAGRAFLAYDITAALSYQDDGKTLKVFLSDRPEGEPS